MVWFAPLVRNPTRCTLQAGIEARCRALYAALDDLQAYLYSGVSGVRRNAVFRLILQCNVCFSPTQWWLAYASGALLWRLSLGANSLTAAPPPMILIDSLGHNYCASVSTKGSTGSPVCVCGSPYYRLLDYPPIPHPHVFMYPVPNRGAMREDHIPTSNPNPLSCRTTHLQSEICLLGCCVSYC